MELAGKEGVNQAVAACLGSPGGKAVFRGAAGSFAAYLSALVMEEVGRPFLFLASSPQEAERLGQDVKFYLSFLSSSGQDRPEQVVTFPAGEPGYSTFSLAEGQEEGTRVGILARLAKKEATAVVLTASALGRFLIPQGVLADHCLELFEGQELERDRLISLLLDTGYQRQPLVEGLGEFSVRGGIVDLFSPSHSAPVRVEFYGDMVESLREFEPASQRSARHLARIAVWPAGQVIYKPDHLNQALSGARELEITYELPRHTVAPLLERLKEGQPFPGISRFVPLFYLEQETILDYFAREGVLVVINPWSVARAYDSFWQERRKAFLRARQTGGLVLPPEVTHLSPEELEAGMSRLRSLFFEALPPFIQEGETFYPEVKENSDLKASLMVSGKDGGIVNRLVSVLASWREKGWQVVVAAASRHSGERLRQLLADAGLFAHLVDAGQPPPEAVPLQIWVGSLSAGFRLESLRLAFLTEEEIFGPKGHLRRGRPRSREVFLSGLRDLKVHDYVVHVDHGIGVYRGLARLTFQGISNDYLVLEYSGGDKLYLPVEKIGLLSRYVGPDDAAPLLDRLGSRTWARVKQKVKASLRQVAQELVKIYAQRQVLSGYAFSGRDHYLSEFEATFPYDETEDQLQAIEEVLSDMQSERPMDRLVCGDVGFGKTEVALRAAFKAVMEGKQVAVLVPTTVLAEQHYHNFSQRLAPYPVRVEVLSRFKSRASQKETIQDLKKGIIDVVIGTHRLLQEDVGFRDLGLLIIDEEHRFGVRHKEKIKKLRALVDAITLSATPIPRTLHLSLAGIRDLSIIETAPQGRLAIATYIIPFDEGIIAQAIRQELARQGQIFFVHNRVQGIDGMALLIKKLVPEGRVAVAHGQMEERDLEQVMLEFLYGNCDVLVTTTIIESGLDYPRANTIFINRADGFGLAQLYQLRGRVGRSSVQAYAYLIIPGKSLLTREAEKRLAALMQLTELGSGFKLAAQDLEIRGAGNILGTAQSGHIKAVGYDLYMDLLAKAIAQLKGEEVKEEVEPTISLGVSAFIPEDYIEDVNTRLVIYKRLSAAGDEREMADLEKELADRFGPLPPLVVTLFKVMGIRLLMKGLLAVQAKRQGQHVRLEFRADTPVGLEQALKLKEELGEVIRLCPDKALLVSVAGLAEAELLARMREVLTALGSAAKNGSG